MFDYKSRRQLSLPHGWPGAVKSAVLHVISLANFVIAHARGWAANSINARVRQASQIDRLKAENAMLKEETRLKDTRMASILPHRRPHYAPEQRLDILAIKATRGWSLTQAARVFLIDAATIATWLKRLDESGPDALVKVPAPVNRFPEFVQHIVKRLKAVCPAMGKVKLAQNLARAGLHLAASTVGRLLKAKSKPDKPAKPDTSSAALRSFSEAGPKPERIVRADYPNHVWHVDLTTVPIGGFWTPWLPFALPQCFPFCWWIAAVIDHFSRKVLGIAVFRKQPTCRQVRDFLTATIRKNRSKPKYIICDKGKQFWCLAFKLWCRRRKIKPRFGAVHKHGSIAVIERFILTMKNEFFRRTLVPLRRREFIRLSENYIDWYNRFRPHTTLHGRTPQERYLRIPAACRRPRFEPRPRWPIDSACASPQAKIRGQPGAVLNLIVSRHRGCKNLPVVSLNRVA